MRSLALATYKAEKPDKPAALKEALALLEQLDLAHTNDPETVSLAGSIEKKRYEAGDGEERLANAIQYFQRGYFLLNNRYNGINLAFTLNYRANSALCTTREEQVADMVYASRTRKRVLEICQKDWDKLLAREKPGNQLAGDNEELAREKEYIEEQKFWILINRAEAYFGLADFEQYRQAREAAAAIPHAGWMMEAFEQQVVKLRALMQKSGHLLNPAWVEK